MDDERLAKKGQEKQNTLNQSNNKTIFQDNQDLLNELRLTKIEQEKQNAINQSDNAYNTLLQDNQNLYKKQNAYAEQYEKNQNDTLDKQLAFNEQKINQQKEIARQNMEAESKRAKNDYTSYINPYGLQAESFASQGLLNSGVSETAKLGGWNTYQNRLATANKVMQDAYVQYDNDINRARLDNDAQKAQNALAKLQMQINASKDFYSNKSTLTQNQLSYNQNLDDSYFNRYQTEYQNIQNEIAREEAIRQYEQQFAYQKEQDKQNLAWQKEQYEAEQAKYKQQFNYQKQQDKQAQSNWEKEYALSKSTASARYGSGGRYATLTDTSQPKSSKNNTNTINTSNNDNLGNNQDTMNKSDYYFKSTTGADYQPRYINNIKLTNENGIKLSDVGTIKGVSGGKNIWKAGNEYFVWDEDHYINVTPMMK